MAASARIEKLLKKKTQIEARLKEQQQIEADKARKRDTRRKILRGTIVEEFADAELLAQVDALMKNHLKERDRDLFPKLFPPAGEENENGKLKGEFQKLKKAEKQSANAE